MFRTEYFGPLLTLHVYDDGDFERVLAQVDRGSPYGAHRRGDRPRPGRGGAERRRRCGSPPATSTSTTSRPAPSSASSRSAAAAPSGTNDKAGSIYNLLRWVSPRTIKETFVPPTGSGYPHQG